MTLGNRHLSLLIGLASLIASCGEGTSLRMAASEKRSIVHVSDATSRTTERASNEQVSLGARLFQDASLSLDSATSCATCHIPSRAFSEPRQISRGIGLRARKRNTPTLINITVFRQSFDWDGRAATLADQLRGVFSVSGDMGIDLGEAVSRIRSDSGYENAFRRAYGRPADLDNFLAALVAFEQSLVIGESRFDRYYLHGDSTALSPSEIRGWLAFRDERVSCGGCHVPLPDPEGSGIMLFTDSRFHNLGVGYRNGRMEDVGRYGVTRQASDWGRFRTPSLRDVALTPPYMHDGSLATLKDVIDFYTRGGIRNPNLDPVLLRPNRITAQDREDLIAFLGTLTTDWLADSAAVARRVLRSKSRPKQNLVRHR